MGNCIYVFSHNDKNNSIDSTENNNDNMHNINTVKTFNIRQNIICNNTIVNNNIVNNNNIAILTSIRVKKIFRSYNILDTNKNIIIGIWDNPNKTSVLGNQGIWIGEHEQIYELVFGMSCHDLVVLYFEKKIILKIIKDKNSPNLFLLELKNNENTLNYSCNLSSTVIEGLKKINDNSSDLDLIFNIIKN